MDELFLTEADLNRIRTGVHMVSMGDSERVNSTCESGMKCNMYSVGENVIRVDFVNSNKE